MSKVITSPNKRFTGSVTIADPMTLPQVEAFEAGLELPKDAEGKDRVFFTVYDRNQLPALFACVEKWELANFPESVTADTFPMTPRKDSHELIEWLFGEIRKVWVGETELPNE